MRTIKIYKKLNEKLKNATSMGSKISNELIENTDEFLKANAKQVEAFSHLDSNFEEIDADLAKQTGLPSLNHKVRQ